ncbi:MAG TPA: glycosyltransferase family 4 protein, partial [Planctomycetia bacterium]|nr:glycosyltransferase family 4 protein [Planctomycetia bacterium]
LSESLPVDRQATLEHWLTLENVYGALKRLRPLLGRAPGVLVASDLIELLYCYAYDPGKAVVQFLHGDFPYYYELARRHETVADAFITPSRAIERKLKALLPHRAPDVHYLPYGVPIPEFVRAPAGRGAPLRLLYSGRLWDDQKNIFALPEIDKLLVGRGAEVVWTIAGAGPDGAELERRFPPSDRVRYTGALPNATLLRLMTEHDVFVLPTRGEGFPVALLEAMSVGLVPVVSDIESGVPEIVNPETGWRPAVGDLEGFAAAIAKLASDRDLLETRSRAARAKIVTEFDTRECVLAYHELYARWDAFKRPWPGRRRVPFGSRLDRPWIPTAVTTAARRIVRGVKSGAR